jgi:hypothetical protein
MIRKLIISILIAFPLTSLGQFERGNLITSLEFSGISYRHHEHIYAGGIDLEYFVTDNLSVNTRITFGNQFAHMPLMVYFFTDLFVEGLITSDDDYYWLIFFAEGISYHIHIGDRLTISPFLHPLGCEYLNKQQLDHNYKPENDENMDTWFISGSGGIRYNFAITPKLIFSPYFEFKTLYGAKTSGFGIGASLGLSLF